MTLAVYQNQSTLTPVLLNLITAATLTNMDDESLQRCGDTLRKHLRNGVEFDFDGTELRVLSASRRMEGVCHVSDGESCTCEGARHPWCWHRLLYRVLFAQAALCGPLVLRAAIVEQAGPAEPPVADAPVTRWANDAAYAAHYASGFGN